MITSHRLTRGVLFVLAVVALAGCASTPNDSAAPIGPQEFGGADDLPVSYTHLRAHETVLDLVCRLLLAKKKTNVTR